MLKRIGFAVRNAVAKQELRYDHIRYWRTFRYSDGYEIAQEAMLFLCQHMGKRLDDAYHTKTGRKITIKQACFSVADRYLAKNFVSPYAQYNRP